MRFFRKIWIGLLSGLAFVSACTCNEHPKVYGPPARDVDDTVHVYTKQQKRQMRQRLEALRNIIKEREMSEVYGSPEIIERYANQTEKLRNEADSLSRVLESL